MDLGKPFPEKYLIGRERALSDTIQNTDHRVRLTIDPRIDAR
jgi:hypothetical protein